MSECPTCGDKLDDYPEEGWHCKCGRCYCVYLGNRYVGVIQEGPEWPAPECRVCRTQDSGLPTPGYVHDAGCAQGTPPETKERG